MTPRYQIYTNYYDNNNFKSMIFHTGILILFYIFTSPKTAL